MPAVLTPPPLSPQPARSAESSAENINLEKVTFEGRYGIFSGYELTAKESRPGYMDVTFSAQVVLDREAKSAVLTKEMRQADFSTLKGRLEICALVTLEDVEDYMAKSAEEGFKSLFKDAAQSRDTSALMKESRIGRFK